MSEHLGEALAALAAGELEPSHRAQLEAHVASCADCARALAEARRVFAALEAPPLEPSPSFDRALYARLDEADASLWSKVRAWLTPPRLALAGAAVAVPLIVAVLVFPDEPELAAEVPVALLAEEDAIEVAENLELLEDLEVIENLDVAEDLELLAELAEEEPG